MSAFQDELEVPDSGTRRGSILSKLMIGVGVMLACVALTSHLKHESALPNRVGNTPVTRVELVQNVRESGQDCVNKLRGILTSLKNEPKSLSALARDFPITKTAAIYSVDSNGNTHVETDSSTPMSLSFFRENHKFVIGDSGDILFLFADNTVVTADPNSCRINGVYLPKKEDGSFHPRVKQIAINKMSVAQDSKKSRPAPLPPPGPQPGVKLECNVHCNRDARCCRGFYSQGICATRCTGRCMCTSPRCSDKNNLARGRPAYQINEGWGGSPGRAVDGNTNQNYNGRSCTHTHSVTRAYWFVDLGSSRRICGVQIYNRRDCCSDRLSNFKIFVTNTRPYNGWQPNKHETCFYKRNGGVDKSRFICYDNFYDPRGRYVGVMLMGKNYLTLCEVQVFGS